MKASSMRLIIIFLFSILIITLNFAGYAGAEIKNGAEATEEFCADRSAGISVKRLTDNALGSMLSYYDIEAQEPANGNIYFNSLLSDELWGISRMDLKRGVSKVVLKRRPATNSTKRFDMSYDGKLITYTKTNEDGKSWDIYGFYSGLEKIDEFRITRENYKLGETPKVKTSPAAYSEKDSKYAIAFSINSRLYIVFSDGAAPDGSKPPLEIELADEGKNISFHRIRLNPAYSNILMYRRNKAPKGQKEKSESDPAHKMFVVDWKKADKRPVAWYDHEKGGPHPAWSSDGEKIGLQQNGAWTEYSIIKNGGIVEGLSPVTAKVKKIGPFSETNVKYSAVFYGTYSKNGKKIAVATRSETDEGGKIYLMDAETGVVKYLCKTLFHGPETDGQPRLRFINDDKNIIFSTDKSYGRSEVAPAQIYFIDSQNGL